MSKFKSGILIFLAITIYCAWSSNRVVLAQDNECQNSAVTISGEEDDLVHLYITESAIMPNLTLILLSENGCDINSVDWELQIEYWDGWNLGTNKILDWKLGAQRRGFLTGDGWIRNITTDGPELVIDSSFWGDTFGGGIGSISFQVQFADGATSKGSYVLDITAENPSSEKVQAYLGDLKYQILGYLESKFYNFSGGVPLLNCGDYECSVSDGGFGLMQITLCEGTAGTLTNISSKPNYFGSGIPSYRQIWDWKANADAGISCFQQKLASQCSHLISSSDKYYFCGYSAYNGSNFYGDLATQIYNEIQQGRFRAGWFK